MGYICCRLGHPVFRPLFSQARSTASVSITKGTFFDGGEIPSLVRRKKRRLFNLLARAAGHFFERFLFSSRLTFSSLGEPWFFDYPFAGGSGSPSKCMFLLRYRPSFTTMNIHCLPRAFSSAPFPLVPLQLPSPMYDSVINMRAHTRKCQSYVFFFLVKKIELFGLLILQGNTFLVCFT